MKKEYRIEYLPVAQKDLAEIVGYIAGDLSSPQAAMNFLDRLDESVGRLSAFPFSCELTKDASLAKKGYRVLVVGNYLVFYVVQEDTVEIRRVLYHKQNYKDLLF